MSCFHPLLALVDGINSETGKDHLRIIPYDEEKKKRYEESGFTVKEIPCGKCVGCRLEYSRQWANRCMLELQYHDSAYFITLTYSDDFLPRARLADPETGELVLGQPTLMKAHLSKFIKHLRKRFPDDTIRFFGAGEYGSRTNRPHYHIIVFGLHLDDLKLYKRNIQGDVLYISDSVSKCWSNYVGCRSDGTPYFDQIGWVVIAPVTWETCAYTARYVSKKMSGPLAFWFEDQKMEMPFSLMSRRPGIAFQWYQDHPSWKDSLFINVSTGDGARKFRPPRYFDKLLEEDIPEEYQARKEERSEFAKRTRELLEKSLDKPYLEYLADKEMLLKNRIKALDRSKI